jgi:hypothetical protein
MMQRFWVIVFLLSPVLTYSQKQEFSWLVGTWKLIETRSEQTNKSEYEEWHTVTGKDILQGKSYRVVGKDTTIQEGIILLRDAKDFYYVPDVAGNQGPVRFKMVQWRHGYFQAENPAHDFPKVIRYQLRGKELNAEIEGDGKIKAYHFEKLR